MSKFADLDQIAQTCNFSGWDGRNALPVTASALNKAKIFATLLQEFPVPNFSATPSGTVIVEWIASLESRLVLSVGDSKLVSWAVLNLLEIECGSDTPSETLRVARKFLTSLYGKNS